MEPPFYKHLNRACRDKDMAKIDQVGPFAAVLGEIIRHQDPFREDKIATAEFKVFRGLTLPESDINGLKYIVEDTEKAKKAIATGENFNFDEMLSQEHDRIEKIVNNHA